MRDTIKVANTAKNAVTDLTTNSLLTLKTAPEGLKPKCIKAKTNGAGRKKVMASQISRRLRSVRPEGRGGVERTGALSDISRDRILFLSFASTYVVQDWRAHNY